MRKSVIALALVAVGVTFLMWSFSSRKPGVQPSRVSDVDALFRQRVVLLRGPLNDEQATEVIAKLLFLQHENPQAPITLVINSPGGSVIAAMAVIDTIRDVSTPVRTRSDGNASGTGALVLASGQRGERVVVRGSSLSLVPITTDSKNTANPDLVRLKRSVTRILAEATGHSEELVDADLVEGKSFDAIGAVKYGLADRVVV